MFNRKKSYPTTELTEIDSTNPSEHVPQCDNVQDSNCSGGNKPPAKNYPFQALIYVLLSSVFLTLSGVIVKKLTYINSSQLALVRISGVFVGCLPIAVYTTEEVIGEKNDRSLLLLRGLLGGTSVLLQVIAFRNLPLAEVAILISTIPTVTSITAFFYLKEPFGLMQAISLILTIAGVLLSVRLPELLRNTTSTHYDYTYAIGLASGMGCVLILSTCYVIQRKMKHVHASVNLLYFGFIGMVAIASINALTATYESPRCGWDQVFVMFVGVFGFFGHCAITVALQKEAAGIVTILRASLDIIVAMVFQIIFFDKKLNAYNFSAACLVIMSVSILGIRNWLRMLPEESNIKKKLKLLLV